MAKAATRNQIRTIAQSRFNSDVVRIDDDAKIIRTSKGAWVQAWVLVDADTINTVAPYRVTD